MVLLLPDIEIRRSRFGLRYNSQIFSSPLSNDTQRLELPGARWVAEYTFRRTTATEVGALQAFLVQCRGMANTFYGYDPDRTSPLGTGVGTPLVNGASQTGSSLVTDGWGNSQVVLKQGDYFKVNGELKMVTANVTSNGSGQATINFAPVLRSSPANNAVITITNPTCTMYLIDDEQAAWERGWDNAYDEITISAIESFDA